MSSTEAITTTIQEPTVTPSTGYMSSIISEGTPPLSYKTLTFNYSANYASISADTTNSFAWYRFNGDTLDYTPNTTKYDLVASLKTVEYSNNSTLYPIQFFQGRTYLSSTTWFVIIENNSLQLSQKACSVAVWMRKRFQDVSTII